MSNNETSNVIPLFQRFGPQPFANPTPPVFYHCGCCECYHPINWDGDCRDDANRFSPDELDEKYPGIDGWTETLSPAIDFEEYIELIEETHGITITEPEAFRERFNSGTPYECDPEFDDFDPNALPYTKGDFVGGGPVGFV